MQVLNFGSLNIDRVYQVPRFAAPGETLSCASLRINAGGKGLNQSVALSRAGIRTAHAGMIGPDGAFLKQVLADAGVDVSRVLEGDTPTGHAVIQVETGTGQNSILLYPGANTAIPEAEMLRILKSVPAGSWLLLQNEINSIPFLIREAKAAGLMVAVNPSPCTDAVRQYPLELCDLIFVNEIETAQLTGCGGEIRDAARLLAERCPNTELIVTLGAAGALRIRDCKSLFVPARAVKAVDTTAAGDTFTGYFMAARFRGMDAGDAMACAAFASSITVSRPGAAASIPTADEVFPFWDKK